MTHASSPDLPTERLLLRTWTQEELAAVLDGKHLPHWTAGFPTEGDKALGGLFATHPDWFGPYGHRQIVERESGQVVGAIGLFWPPAEGVVEFGYGLAPSHWGQGYATEAAHAVVAHALAAPGVHTVCAKAALENPASIRVLEKAGLVPWPDENLEPGLTRLRTPAQNG
ncbi:GNAT family N-acetyltransferase [Streptomyces sp. NPDC051561]|uniref:GNAT family N-acetyltransferase n=1 Tax=Streptomyces sp. NPDC051561 TaxID=3365658 RepID=UPI00378AB3E2